MQNFLLSALDKLLKMSHAGMRCWPPHRSQLPAVGAVAVVAAADAFVIGLPPLFVGVVAAVAATLAAPIGLLFYT